MPKTAAPHSRTRTAAVVFAGFCAFLTIFAPQPMLPMLAKAFDVTPGRISLVVTAFLLAVPTLLAATATSYGQLLFWRFLQGVFTPGIFAVIIAYVNEEWEHGAGAATAAYITGTVLGGFTGRVLAAIVASHAGWRWAFVTLGILNVLGAF